MANYGSGAWGADRDQPSPQQRIILRLGTRIALDAIPSLPEHYRARESQSHGKLGQVLLQVATGALWCRLDAEIGGQVWPPSIIRTEPRTLPLNSLQPSTPPPDTIALLPNMVVEGHEGAIGKLTGIVVTAASGTAASLVVRIRDRIEDDLTGASDPLTHLLRVAGSEVLLAPDWAKAPEAITHFLGTDHLLRLDATNAQVAQGLVLRPDRAITQQIWDILGENRALAPYYPHLSVVVQDGTVTIGGPALAPRLRAALEQDIWHVSGVLALRSRFGD